MSPSSPSHDNSHWAKQSRHICSHSYLSLFLVVCKQVTQKLVDFAVKPGENTEVRIAACLTAVRCANYEDLQTIVTKISVEENTQGESSVHVCIASCSAEGDQHLGGIICNLLSFQFVPLS